jgi:hypothetical protein
MADFGEVLRELQLFEVALLGIAMSRGFTPDRLGTEDWRRHVEDLYGRTAGRLVEPAQFKDPDLADQVKRVVRLRNGLVHGWLIVAVLDIRTGRRTIEEKRRALRVAREWIAEVREAVDVEYAKAIDELDQEPLSAERLAELWREDLPPPDEG